MNKSGRQNFRLPFLLVLALATGAGPARMAAQEQLAAPAWPPGENAIVATVDGFGIRAGLVLNKLQPNRRSAAEKNVPPPAVELWVPAVEHLIDRQAVLRGLASYRAATGPSEMKMELGRLGKQLESAGGSLDAHIASLGLTQAEFENELRWQLTWQRLLQRMLTEEAVEKFFEQHRRDFDGTTMLVDQILWVWDDQATNEQKQELQQQASGVFDRLKRGELLWDDTVREFSMSPLAGDPRQAGRLIGRQAPMPPAFSAAAFALEVNEISPPVETLVGIHIIRCLEIRPGDRVLNEVDREVRSAMAERMFKNLVDRHRPSSDISYGEGFPQSGHSGDSSGG